MKDPANFKHWEKQLRILAWKIQRRLYAAGAVSTQLDDVFSECCVAWCVARDKYDPAHGVPFGPYLTNGIKLHIKRWSNGQVLNGRALSLDASPTRKPSDEGLPLKETIVDETQTVGETFENRQALQRFMSNLPARARQYLTLLAEPPEELREISRAIEARTRYARSRGYARFAFKHVYSRIIFDLMDCTQTERGQISTWIKNQMERKAYV